MASSVGAKPLGASIFCSFSFIVSMKQMSMQQNFLLFFLDRHDAEASEANVEENIKLYGIVKNELHEREHEKGKRNCIKAYQRQAKVK